MKFFPSVELQNGCVGLERIAFVVVKNECLQFKFWMNYSFHIGVFAPIVLEKFIPAFNSEALHSGVGAAGAAE